MNDAFLITIIFRIINFSILIALAVYAFYTYLYPIAVDQIAEKEAFFHGLFQQNTMLESKQRKLDEKLTQQKVYCKEIENRILFWQSEVIKQEQLRASQGESLRMQNNQKAVQRGIWLSNNQLQTHIFSQVINQTEQRLIDQLQQTEQGSLFIKNIVLSINKQKQGDM